MPRKRQTKNKKTEQEVEQTDLLSGELEPLEEEVGAGEPAAPKEPDPDSTEDLTEARDSATDEEPDGEPGEAHEPGTDEEPAQEQDLGTIGQQVEPDAPVEAGQETTDAPEHNGEQAEDAVPSDEGEECVPVSFDMVSEEGRPLPAPPAGEQLGRAKELVRDGRIDEAIALYREILAQNPSNLKARNNLGVLYDELGSLDLALEQFEAAELIEPENVELLNNYGSVLGAMGRYDDAADLLRCAQRLEADNILVRASLGILHFRRGVYAVAEADLAWVCDRDESNGPAFYYRGEALNRLGRYDEAMQVLERAIVLQPHNAKAFYTLGHLYDRKHMGQDAAIMYRRARELSRG